MKKIIISLLMVFMMFSLVACVDSFKQGMKDGMSGTVRETEEPETQEQEKTEPETKETEPEAQEPEKTEPETKESEVPAETEPETTADQETQETTPEAAEAGNPLMDAEVSVYDVMNGTKTEKLGEWAEIRVSKAILIKVTQEQFSEFCNTRVKDSGYNWYSINCGDGTGIQFAGSISSVATYGTIDNESCIVESSGTIMVQEDGTYSYTKTE